MKISNKRARSLQVLYAVWQRVSFSGVDERDTNIEPIKVNDVLGQ